MAGENLTREEAHARAQLLTVEQYSVELDLTTATTQQPTFRSVTSMTFACTTPGSATFVDLIAPTVHEVVLNGRSLSVADVVSPGRIALTDLQQHNELRVVADAAYMRSGEGLHRFVDPVDQEVYLYSQFEVADARRVFACFDQPDLKARFTFTITAPQHWTVVSCEATPTPEPVREGVARWSFAQTPLLSTYVTAVVAGPYHGEFGELSLRDGRTIPMGVYCRRSLAEHLDATEVMDIARAGFAWYEKTFDCDYPFSTYDQLFVPEFNAGAMENAGAVTFTELYVFRSKVPQAMVERRALTILHELAHMWFGDLVTMRWWDDLWLNESFAEYASTRCQAEATRWSTAWTTFSSAEKSWAYRQDQLSTTHPIVADIRDLADVEVNFDGITYAKGASVLKQLVHWVGEAAFDAGLRRYFATHAWGNTTLADLFTHLEEASGRDLSAWSQQWLQQAGVTTLLPEIIEGSNGTMQRVLVHQEAPADHPVLRPHRLAIGSYDLVDGRLTRTHRVELDVAGATTEVAELAGQARPALLLINDDDLAYAKIRLDERSLATATDALDAFTDPLAAALVWGAAWDMTRDAQLPARDFATLVLSNIAAVTDPSVSQTLLRQLAGTLDGFVAPQHRHSAAADAGDRLLTLLRQAAPGSDQQLLFARFFAQIACTPAQFDVLAALLAGAEEIDGLVVDTDLRWVLLIALVAADRADAAQIEAQLGADDTATGRLYAATARAAVPTAAAKAAAWEQVVGRGELPNAEQEAVIAGLRRVHDRSLLAPYLQPYFDCLAGLREQRTSEMASQIAVGLYPAEQPLEQVLAATDVWLAGAGSQVEAGLLRQVREGRDAAERALRAQQRDALA